MTRAVGPIERNNSGEKREFFVYFLFYVTIGENGAGKRKRHVNNEVAKKLLRILETYIFFSSAWILTGINLRAHKVNHFSVRTLGRLLLYERA